MGKPNTSHLLSTDDVDLEHNILPMLNYPNFSDEGDIDSEIDDSDEDPDFMVPNVAGSDMSDSSDELLDSDIDGGELNCNLVSEFYYAKPKQNEYVLKWSSSEPRQNVRVPAHNIVRGELPGLRGDARTLGKNPGKNCVWNPLFDVMLRKIADNTYIKLSSVRQSLLLITTVINVNNYIHSYYLSSQ